VTARPAAAPAGQRARWLAPLLVAAVTAAAFLPALANGFVNWDDHANFVDNPHYRGLGWPQLRWMFTTTHMGPYVPLTWLTLGADYVVWGMRPFGYHLTSVLLHVATAVAVYFLGLRLLRLAVGEAGATSAPSELDLRVGAAIGALLFAVHPLRVESVAWVTERRDVLSGLLFVAAALAYVKAARGGPRLIAVWYRAALALYVAALLSKSIAVTLPAVLLALDVYPLRRLGGSAGWRVREVWLEKLPFLALAGGVSAIAVLGVWSDSYLRPMGEMGVGIRLMLSVYGLAFYLIRSLVPLGLLPLYQLPLTVTWMHLAIVGLGPIAIVLARRRAPALAVAAVAYVTTVLPVLGILQNGPQAVADRYSYLPSMGWAVLIGGLAARRWTGTAVLRAVLAVWIVAMGALTWQQSQVWRDSVSLWTHAIGVNPAARAAHANLARAHSTEGNAAAAIAHWNETRRLSIHQVTFLLRIAELYDRAGLPGPALAHYGDALRHSPGLPEGCAAVQRLTRAGHARPPAAIASCAP
jgi:protein O-mannosyl-transferase